ncbi:PREDICTED: uncharacterized protein LOC109153274 [Ipomoea nil]|uniref:uncharacterized protein LOC109153274 n=1 Tax=Ipomoea nil TaxID=35883 RepID=UPI000900BAC5|nr:PREDICTED: uncharacterized protein LOC109153274 [Ipomoea nil]
MDPAKKRKMLDDINEKRRVKSNAAKSTLTHDVNAAKRFQYEPPGFCCSSGQVVLVSNEMPPLLKQYFCEKDEVSRHFQACVRTYNNTFAFTSLGIHNYDKNLSRRNKGIYTFKVQGQMYHFINDLVPENQPPKNLQLYFFDTEHEVENRIKGAERMEASVVENLIDVLGSNPYSQFFRNLKDISSIEDCNIVIRSNATLDQRVYNMPTSSQVAAIWVEEQDGSGENSRDIKVFAKTGRSHSVKYYYGCYDPLQYPLLFPHGESGWHEGISKVPKSYTNRTSICQGILQPGQFPSIEALLDKENENIVGKSKRNTVSCREYYAYRFQIRPNDKSMLLHSGRLFQQFIVDTYIEIETQRLDYFRAQQRDVRTESMQGLVDSIACGETNASNVGRRVILPVSFIGGPRDMRKRYMNAMTLVQRYGKPDIFLTITCNPNWPEIKNSLEFCDEPQNRPDLISRVFRAKLEELKVDLIKKKVFGVVIAYTYVIEFQKRGLPHAHFLLILGKNHKFKSGLDVDAIVSAEIPDAVHNSSLHSLVAKHMIHGPCGSMNPENPCMVEKSGARLCKNKYPKGYSDATVMGENSYPTYKRRNNSRFVTVRGHQLDNKWVIPYNAYLLSKFDCHINVEVCASIKCVKYIYKYIYKGHDRVAFSVSSGEEVIDFDEIKEYQNARWVSPPEAAWRIYGFSLAEIKPAVVDLQVHLENYQYMRFDNKQDLIHLVDNQFSSKTMLTEFFFMNMTDETAKRLNLLYLEFPEFFVWVNRDKQWYPRKKREVIGRLVSVNPIEGERYYLRMLLMNVRAPKSYEHLKMVGESMATTFREVAEKLGLLQSDQVIDQCLQEAMCWQMPTSFRRLFATLLIFCNIPSPHDLWTKYKEHLCEDIISSCNSIIDAENKCLHMISDILESLGKNINDFGLVSYHIGLSKEQRIHKEIQAEKNLLPNETDLLAITKLNQSQRVAFDTIISRVYSNSGGVFFVDGPGGTGKTFLYRCLLARVRANQDIALATATSGVAASLLPGGRTAHSRFKIPINGDDKFVCNIGKQSAEASLLRECKLILWDEATMANRRDIENVETTLRDITNNDTIFGGKVVVFGGDFRQTLPVIRSGSRQDFIEASLVKSHKIWPIVERLVLTENMRAKEDPSFCEYLMRVGNGTEKYVVGNSIQIPRTFLVPSTDELQSFNSLIDIVFPDLMNFTRDPYPLMKRGILTPKNEFVDEINNSLIDRFPGDEKCYISYDELLDSTCKNDFVDYLHTISVPGLPPHKLIVKKNCPVILLRNINPAEGLCNGTRLICDDFRDHVIRCFIASGEHIGKHVFIPRIPLEASKDENCSLPFKRHQFPIKVCFAMTINKAQGQTFDFVGIYLRQPVFSHGQLYVALSRAKKADCVKMLLCNTHRDTTTTDLTDNIVYQEILNEACGSLL